MITQAIHFSEDFYQPSWRPVQNTCNFSWWQRLGFSNYFELTIEIAATCQMSLYLYDISMIEMSEIRSDPSQVSVHDAVLSSPEFFLRKNINWIISLEFINWGSNDIMQIFSRPRSFCKDRDRVSNQPWKMKSDELHHRVGEPGKPGEQCNDWENKRWETRKLFKEEKGWSSREFAIFTAWVKE